jgi:hypothetical protein
MKSTVDRRRFSLIIIAALIVAISVFNFYFNRILYNSYNCNFHSTRESDVKQSMESSKCMELFVHEASYDKWGQKPKRFLMEIWNRALQLPQSISASIGPWKVFHMTPQTYHCKPDDLIRIGDDGDGGKLVCTEYFPKNKPGCLVVSLGSRGIMCPISWHHNSHY